MAYPVKRAQRTRQVRAPQRNSKVLRDDQGSWLQRVDWARFRFRLAGGLFLVIWFVLWGRAASLQLFDGGFLAERARRQHTAVEMVTGQRGMITDRNGQILARSVECRSVYVNPREVSDVPHTVNTLSELLRLPAADIAKIIERGRAFAWLARKVDDATAESIRKAHLTGVGLVKEFERIYPFKQVAGQLLGFTNVDTNGLEGLERAFDNELNGISTRRTVRRDASGRRFYVSGGEVPSGQDIQLTIDVQIQFLAEEALAEAVQAHEAKWAGALVVDVAEGDILAWAQYPFFNPNAFRDFPPNVYRNRIALDALEPGSILKPMLVGAALQEGLISPDTEFNCENGVWKTKRVTIRDDRRSYGILPVHRILSLSSNIGSAKIGLKLGADKYQQYLTRLGFGQRTGLPVAESKGILRRAREWSETDTISISFGQGMSATLLQMAQSFLTLGNGGAYKPLRITREEGIEVQGAGQRIFSEKVSRQVLEMMREVVEDGTGGRARITGVSVAGKTGTAQKAKSGSYGEQRTGSFVGFVPAENPRYLVVIMIDEPQKTRYGGVIATPVFRNVMARTLAYHGAPPEVMNEPEPLKTEQATATRKKAANAKDKQANNKKGKQVRQPEPPKTSGLAVLSPELDAVSDTGEYRYDMTERVRQTAGTTVPNVVGKSVRRAVELFAVQGIMPVVRGEGSTVVRQTPDPGTSWPANSATRECILWISEQDATS